MIVVGAELGGGLLRQAEEEISEIKTRARNRLAVDDLGSVGSGKNEGAAGIAVGFGVELDAAEVPAPAPGVLAMVPDQIVGESNGLVALQQWIGVLQAAEVGEREIGQAPIEGILRDAVDAEISGDVLGEGVEILSAHAVA